ncbi:hypothetical protein [Methanocaldococcus infernus]|uniref:Uncharacterized protein n=1 Tax=Methanocaldococcus infernus (strain DSM 11812 / JCM 15783 / ME) TaxID=573063 RepID=D5VR87_METIM|nr:hypothetical protein [Methanocaldococcus infernus]ADG13090.1 conserved hypothetical protein [Methanocaldococcus infernus ME]
MDINERIDVLSRKLLEIEKRVDLKIKESEKKLEKMENEKKIREILLVSIIYLKILEETKKNFRILRLKILILYILIAILYIINIIILVKVIT